MTDDATATAARVTLPDRVYAAVRDMIISGRLKAGEFVREQDLSDGLGVSRTPVREGLGRLASEGLLERIPHRGFRVPARTLAGLLELYPIVSALELLAGQLAFPSVDGGDLVELERWNERLGRAVESGLVEEAIACNESFHGLISERGGNETLAEMLTELRSRLRPLERWYYSSREHGAQSVREHASLIEALETGELERALGIFQRNMALTASSVREREPEATTDRGGAGL